MKSKPAKLTENFPTFWRPIYLGLLCAVLAVFISVLPSLLPRPWYIQGFITGLSAALGYLLGIILSSSVRWFMNRDLLVAYKQQAWQIALIILPLLLFSALFMGRIWQNDVRSALGIESIGPSQSVLILISSGLFFCIFFFMGRAIRRLSSMLQKLAKKYVPQRIGITFAVVLTFFIVYTLLSGVLARSFYTVADAAFGARDQTAPEGIIQPQSPYRSGSPASLIPWEKVGFQGRGFVGSGPTIKALEEFSGTTAREPVRVYAGLASADTAEERAELAVQELIRTQAFEREILVIATATGTGWLDPTVTDALEFMYNGDSAIVSQQYSYLPSWISFLVDQERAKEAGRVLYDAVLEEWIKIPSADRPKLLVYGLSLGSFAGQDAFSGVNDIRRSVDGALFSGTPNDTDLWRNITARRDEGSPEWQPIYEGGKTVRFASTKEDMLENQEVWLDSTRILFIQHANDPVVWFSFDLLFNKPDWLSETRGVGVSGATRWFPIITFLHIGLDQAIAASAPIGNGHYYTDTTAYAWEAIAAPDGWTTSDSDRLQKIINAADYITPSTSVSQ
jgi:uncharacterized membrane protein